MTGRSGYSVFLVLTGLFFVKSVQASHHDDVKSAATYFSKGEHEKALELWNGMIQAGHRTAGIYYNIGVAESLSGDNPSAILAFENALRLKPQSQEIHDALEQERRKIPDGLTAPGNYWFPELIRKCLGVLRPGIWALISLLILGYGVMRMVLPGSVKGFAPSRRQGMIICTTGIVFMIWSLLAYRQLYRSNEGILMEASELRQAPGDDSPVLSNVSAGEKLFIRDKIGEWYQVRLINYEEGWIRDTRFKIICP